MLVFSDNKGAPDASIKRIDTCHHIAPCASTDVDTIVKVDRLWPFLSVKNVFFPAAKHRKKMLNL